jgi:hypothetical protein
VIRVPGYRSRGPGFDTWRYQIFWEVVGLQRDPLSLVSTIEELLERKSNGFGLGNPEYGRRDPPRWPLDPLYPQKLTLTSPTSGSRSVGIVRSRTQATGFLFLFVFNYIENCKIYSWCVMYVCVPLLSTAFIETFRAEINTPSLVVKVLGYKPEGRVFETRWSEILNLPNPSGRIRSWGLLSL